MKREQASKRQRGLKHIRGATQANRHANRVPELAQLFREWQESLPPQERTRLQAAQRRLF